MLENGKGQHVAYPARWLILWEIEKELEKLLEMTNQRKDAKLIFLTILMLFLTNCTSNEKSLGKLNELYRNQDYIGVLELFNENDSILQNDSRALNTVGRSMLEKGDYLPAKQFFERAIELDPYESMYYSNKCLSLIELGEYLLAIISCDMALDLDKDNAFGYLNRGYANLKIGKWERALEDTETALESGKLTRKEKGVGYGNLSTIYLYRDEFDKSLEYTNLAIKNNNQVYWAFTNRAAIYLSTPGNIEKGIADIEKGLSIRPNDTNLLYYKSLVWIKTDKKDKGCQLLRGLVDRKSDNKFAESFVKYCLGN